MHESFFVLVLLYYKNVAAICRSQFFLGLIKYQAVIRLIKSASGAKGYGSKAYLLHLHATSRFNLNFAEKI